jgi:hypothetical protein
MCFSPGNDRVRGVLHGAFASLDEPYAAGVVRLFLCLLGLCWWGGLGRRWGGGGKVEGPVFVSAFLGSSMDALFLRVRTRSRASAQRERYVAQVPLRCASREERTVLVTGSADEAGCPMPCRSAGKDAGSVPIIVIMGSCVQAS